MYASRDQILRTLTETHERTLDNPVIQQWFGGAVLIREITAAQRLQAQAAAVADNPDEPDNALYQAMLMQMSIVDPESGRPYADGRTDDAGNPLIDPRTRTPIFTVNDLELLMQARYLVADVLIANITELAALLPRHLKSGDPAHDRTQRGANAGVEAPRHPDLRVVTADPDDNDGGSDVGAEDRGSTPHAAGVVSAVVVE